jgi:type IV pilus assembly protein PilC
MKYIYQARTKEGERKTGHVEASSFEAALDVLQKHELFITVLESVQSQKAWEKKITILQFTSRKDIVNFSRQLSIMFKSNVSLAESLETIANQEPKQGFKEKILKISRKVKGGTSFSDSLAEFPKLFSTFYVSMVKSGEASGSLADSLNYLADHLEREYNLRASIIGAMIYPALVIVVMLGVMIVMMVFVIPNLTEVLQETGQELPLVTRIVIFISDFLITKGWVLIIVVPLLSFILYLGAKTKQGSSFLHKSYLKIPILGKFLKMVYLSTFAENLSTLIAGGLPIVQALEISSEIITNTTYRKVLKTTRDEVEKGQNISSVLGRFPSMFPPMFCQMVSVGEKTGSLDKTLLNVVSFYQKEVDRAIKALLSIIEPLLIVFLGGAVGIIIAAVLLPMYQMTSSV